MSKTQIQQIVVVLLLVGFVGFWTVSRGSGKKGPQAPTFAPQGGTRTSPSRPAPAQKEAPAWDLRVSRDPFQLAPIIRVTLDQKEQARQLALTQKPPEPEPEPEPEMLMPVLAPPLTVQGLMMTQGKPQAIVNRKIVGIGDIIEEAKVIKITLDSVIVLYHEKEFTFTIQGSSSGNQSTNTNSWQNY